MLSADNMSSRTGKVKEIELHNFLVHKSTKIQLGLNCNLITGHNGSGKSAVASALAICLGEKGSQAGRKISSLKEYVRVPPDGEQPLAAVVRVQFVNTGENAFEREKYGNVIILERHIAINGTSTFKIGGENLKPAVVKRPIIDAYRQRLSIDMTNVAVYLNQDSARKLLKSSSPSDFYKFFEDTLNLKDVYADQQKALDEVESAEKSMAEAKRIQAKEVQRFNNCQKQLESYEQRLRLKEEEERLKCRIHWKKLGLVAKDIELLTEQHNQLEKEIEDIQELINGLKQQMSKSEEKERLRKEEINNQITEKVLETEELETWLKTECQPRYLQAKEKLKELKQQERESRFKLKKLEDEKNELQDGLDVNVAPQEREKADLQNLVNQLEAEITETQKELGKIEMEEMEDPDEKQRLQTLLDSEMEDLKIAQQEWEEVSAQQRPQLNSHSENFRKRFGYDFNQVMADVQKDRKMSAVPIGPVAAHIYASDQLWANEKMLGAVEIYMLKFLDDWLVPTHADQSLLEGYLRNAGCQRPHVVVSSEFHKPFPWHDSMYQRSPNLLYLIDLLKIPNACMKNYVIQKGHIESSAVFSTYSEMYSAVKSPSLRLTRGLECESSRFGIRYGGGGGIEVPPASKFRIGPNDHLIRRQGELTEREYREQKEAACRHAKAAVQMQKEKVKSVADEMSSFQEKQRRINGWLEKLRAKLSNLSEKKRRAEATIEDIEGEIKSRLAKKNQLEAEGEKVKQIEDEMERLKAKIAKIAEAVAAQASEVAKCEAEISGAKLKISQNDNHIQTLELSLNEKPFTCERNKAAIDEHYCNEDAIGRRMAELTALIEDKQEEYKDLEKDALAYQRPADEEINDGLSIESIKQHLDGIVSQLILAEDLTDAEVETLRQQVATASSSVNSSRENVGKLETAIERQTETHAQICEKIIGIIHTAAARATTFFDKEMQLISNLEPRMTFNHGLKQLHFFTRRALTPVDLNTLSGGERASLQAGMLMALAESSDSPFHLLDEFDVYMDDTTRAEVMKLLFEFAKRNPHRQFLIVTPHEESSSFFESHRRQVNDENFEVKNF